MAPVGLWRSIQPATVLPGRNTSPPAPCGADTQDLTAQ
jgi:hypothetical protein